MEDVIRVQDHYYILATASRIGERPRVLQHHDTFAVFDPHGDIGALGSSEQGLFHEGTRYLSRFCLRLNGRRPLLLSSHVKTDNELFGADLTNPDMPVGEEGHVLVRDIVHLFRARFLWDGTWHERIRLWNYGHTTVPLRLTFDYDADFADIFEVRGTPRERRGTTLDPVCTNSELRLGYVGLDHEERWAILEWSETPQEFTATFSRFEYDLAPQSAANLSLSIRCERQRRFVAPRAYEIAQADLEADCAQARAQYTVVDSSSERFNEWVRRSAADLRMLVSRTPYGMYPYAGVPWFSTPFGRDGITVALQMLWVNPNLARDVLAYLAATQADKARAEQDAEPGKILHESRSGEMARLGEVPFARYYGSVDATPLFIVLAGAYFERTGDLAFLKTIWPNVLRALDWIDRYGDLDGDGFVEYARRSSSGLIHQGWKDSHDSVFHADGTLAEGPIALCEVQGYVYDAKLRAAAMLDAIDPDSPKAGQLRQQAETLRRNFQQAFWCEDESTFALALDGHKRPCRVRTSNAGQCLASGLPDPEHARRIAEQLLGPDMFSGWGIRTVSAVEARYNPMSYHNGSIWPHDNGLIAAGCSRYDLDPCVLAPFSALFEASIEMEGRRLPELFCGFHRRPGEGPTLYPNACSPQAWASGVVFHFLQSCLRLSIDLQQRRLLTHRPLLPPFLSYVRLLNLRLPFGEADLLFERHGADVNARLLRHQGEFELATT